MPTDIERWVEPPTDYEVLIEDVRETVKDARENEE